MSKKNYYNWPGWSSDRNPYGRDFDTAARKRMVAGSLLLLPFIKKHEQKLGKNVLEIGPFFDPLISIKNFADKNIYYLDNDRFVVNHWKNKSHSKLKILKYDLNKSPSIGIMNNKFNCIVVSQVLNYVDYGNLLKKLRVWMKIGGYLFTNNVINHGIPQLFSKCRPKNNAEIIEGLHQHGFKVVERHMVESINKKVQKNNRMILVAEKL